MQIKYQIKDCLQIKNVIVSIGYKSIETNEHTDTYYLSNADQNGFRNVSLRYRIDSKKGEHFILHEDKGTDGQQQVGQSEIAVNEDKGRQLAMINEKLFGISCVIEKDREVFAPVDEDNREVVIAVDSVKGLGCFVEIEIPEEPKSDDQKLDALVFMKSVAAQIGLVDRDLVDQNYPDMLQKPKLA